MKRLFVALLSLSMLVGCSGSGGGGGETGSEAPAEDVSKLQALGTESTQLTGTWKLTSHQQNGSISQTRQDGRLFVTADDGSQLLINTTLDFVGNMSVHKTEITYPNGQSTTKEAKQAYKYEEDQSLIRLFGGSIPDSTLVVISLNATEMTVEGKNFRQTYSRTSRTQGRSQTFHP